MSDNVTRIRDSDVRARVTVLETQMQSILNNVEKLETKMEGQYLTLHSRISDLRDDITSVVEIKNDRIIEKLEAEGRANVLNRFISVGVVGISTCSQSTCAPGIP